MSAVMIAQGLVTVHGYRVTNTWVQEFGYASLAEAVNERGPRLKQELSNHAKRLADRAQMGAGTPRIVGRSGVIR